MLSLSIVTLAASCGSPPTGPLLIQPAPPPTTTAGPSQDLFHAYHDSATGLSFQYPAAWGIVIRNTGNRKDEGSLCPGLNVGGPLAASVRDGDVLPIYDVEFAFSKEEVVLHVLTGLATQSYVSYCNQDGSGIDTAEEEKTLVARAPALTLPGPSSGIPVYKLMNYFDAANDAEDTSADVYLDPIYIVYHNATRYEISVRLTIPGPQLESSGCVIPPDGDRISCASAWLTGSPAAQQLRSQLDDLEHMVASLRFGR